MFDLLVACFDPNGEAMPSALFIALKTYLTAKNDRINDNITLAFETACQEVSDMIELSMEPIKLDSSSEEEEPLKRPGELHKDSEAIKTESEF